LSHLHYSRECGRRERIIVVLEMRQNADDDDKLGYREKFGESHHQSVAKCSGMKRKHVDTNVPVCIHHKSEVTVVR